MAGEATTLPTSQLRMATVIQVGIGVGPAGVRVASPDEIHPA